MKDAQWHMRPHSFHILKPREHAHYRLPPTELANFLVSAQLTCIVGETI